jgi:hypothetical protein
LATEPESAASSASNQVIEALSVALDNPGPFEQFLDGVLAEYQKGSNQLGLLARAAETAPFFALMHNLRLREPLDEAARSRLGEDRVQSFFRLHKKYYPILEDLFDATIEYLLFEIENSWTNIRSQPIYHPDDREILMSIAIMRGLDTLYQSVDRVDDFLRLAGAISRRCQEALSYVRTTGVRLSDRHFDNIQKGISELDGVTKNLGETVREIGQIANNPSEG